MPGKRTPQPKPLSTDGTNLVPARTTPPHPGTQSVFPNNRVPVSQAAGTEKVRDPSLSRSRETAGASPTRHAFGFGIPGMGSVGSL